MKVLGLNFTKIDLEKKSDNLKNLKISTGIDVLDIKEARAEIFNPSDSLILVKFEYIINYEKDIALLKFNGNLMLSLEAKEAKEVLNQWKDKNVTEEFRLSVFNVILRKASLKALQFEEELNLPSHIPLPSFKSPEKKKQF